MHRRVIVVYNYLSMMNTRIKQEILLYFIFVILLNPTAAQNLNIDLKPDELRYRSMIRTENLAVIDQYKAKYSQYYQAGPTKFTHLSSAEFAQTYLGYLGPSPSIVDSLIPTNINQPVNDDNHHPSQSPTSKAASFATGSVPPKVFYVNWNGTNATYVTEVKNQGECGSCWAFAGVAEIESFYLWKHKLWLDLSEQQMIDCVPLLQTRNAGCRGGYLDSVGVYSVRYPIALEQTYPYIATEGTCNAAKIATAQYSISSYTFIADCDTLAYTLLNTRPIGVCLNLDKKWESYIGGIIPDCNDVKIGGHCVLLVGAKSDGTTNVSTNYWIVRNSWGTNYGEDGYMRLYKDPADISRGFCGLCATAVFSQ